MEEQQLNLELDIKNDASLSDFSGPSWVSIFDAVRQVHMGFINQLFLFGSSGTGKSHLLSSICGSFLDADRSAISLSLSDVLYMDTSVLASLETFEVIAIDDIDVIQGYPHWQEAVFHLINRTKEQNKKIIFSSSKPVTDLSFSLLDLVTRLSQATAFKMPEGHDIADREAMLQSILRRRGWLFDERIIQHLLTEGPHSIGGMVKILSEIQPMFASLPRKSISKITINDAMHNIDELTLTIELEGIQELAKKANAADLQDENLSFHY